MNLLTALGEVLPVLATVLLLGLWLYQQTQIEQRTSDLQKLASARAEYQTYQSNNAIFNAIIEMAAVEKSEKIRQFQIYNYELGLRAIENVLPTSDKRDIPPAPAAYDSSALLWPITYRYCRNSMQAGGEVLYSIWNLTTGHILFP
jgi:hypothetical protein